MPLFALEKQLLFPPVNLAEPDGRAFDLMLRYVRHVAVYKAMREAEYHDKDPIDLGEPWPDDLLAVVEHTTASLQNRYDSLLAEHLQSARVAVRADT